MMSGMELGGVRVFGDVVTVRRKLRGRLASGRHFLDEIDGARERLERLPAESLHTKLQSETVIFPLEGRIEKWRADNRRVVENHLGSAGEGLFPDLASYHDPGSLLPAMDRLEHLSGRIRADLDVLQEVAAHVPARRGVSEVASAAVHLDELWVSGLIDPELLRSYELRLSSVGTRRNAAVAIGAAKELVESTMKAALDRLDEEPPRSTDDFLTIAKRVRQALVARADSTAPDSRGRHSLERLQIGLAGMLQGLDEWRNLYGTGHGRTSLPDGLMPRHARLAVDSAESYVRFLVSTLDDLGLLDARALHH